MEDLLLQSEGDTVKIHFPFISDNNAKVSNQYGMLHAWEEIKRLVLALQTSEKNQVSTPANWNYGDDVLLQYLPFSESDYSENQDLQDQYYKVGVNMWYKRISTY
jgi:peroxiredoxin (alkyl hydroperoxide reductase subunit C)